MCGKFMRMQDHRDTSPDDHPLSSSLKIIWEAVRHTGIWQAGQSSPSGRLLRIAWGTSEAML